MKREKFIEILSDKTHVLNTNKKITDNDVICTEVYANIMETPLKRKKMLSYLHVLLL